MNVYYGSKAHLLQYKACGACVFDLNNKTFLHTTPPAGPERMALEPLKASIGVRPPSDCMNSTRIFSYKTQQGDKEQSAL